MGERGRGMKVLKGYKKQKENEEKMQENMRKLTEKKKREKKN